MAQDMPNPGEFVYKETPWNDYNKTKCVADSKWETSADLTVEDDEFVTQSLNSLGILDKRNANEVEKVDGRWEIPYEE